MPRIETIKKRSASCFVASAAAWTHRPAPIARDDSVELHAAAEVRAHLSIDGSRRRTRVGVGGQRSSPPLTKCAATPC